MYDTTVPLTKIPQIRIIGGKYNMLANISAVMDKEEINGKIFFDVFSGSGAVGRFFKRKFSIISNDSLYFSYILQKALIDFNKYPKFQHLNATVIPHESNQDRIQGFLNALNNIEGLEGFIFQHYTPASKAIDGIERKYFSEVNGKKIDAIRSEISRLLESRHITQDEYFYLLASLILAVQKVANISGTYGTFNKIWDPRSKNPLKLQIIEVIDSDYEHKAFNSDSFNILSNIKCDIAYVDPPYNARQYIANYHILETIARYDTPIIKGKSGMRPYNSEKSTFCSKRTAAKELYSLLYRLNTKYIILSYNSEGLITKEQIKEIFEKCNIKNIKIYEFPYRRFKSNYNTNGDTIREFIFTGKK